MELIIAESKKKELKSWNGRTLPMRKKIELL